MGLEPRDAGRWMRNYREPGEPSLPSAFGLGRSRTRLVVDGAEHSGLDGFSW